MSTKSKDLATRVNELRFHVVDAEVRLHNTFNEFNMLADNQFIENRVYEDDDADSDEDEKKGEEKDVKEEDPMVLMKAAYNNGLLAMKYFYMDDEDDAMDEKSEDYYNSQPLPSTATSCTTHTPDSLSHMCRGSQKQRELA